MITQPVDDDGNPVGDPETLTARAVITAVGQPQPTEGPRRRRTEASPARSSTPPAGDDTVELTGKRVAMIGAGRRGSRSPCDLRTGRAPDRVPAQRPVDVPNPNYHEKVGPGVQWALRHLPFYGRWYRFLLFWPGCDKGLEPGGRPRLPPTSSGR